MTVYVDDMYRLPMSRFGRMKMSHMVADTLEELHAMADAIGVPRKWVQKAELGQGWVHDIAMSARAKAVAAGAVGITVRELAMKCTGWQQARYYAAAAEQGRMQALAARNGKGDAC
jgi:Protein of unknown function (DUF4031)